MAAEKLTHKTVQASSILEVVVAMVIILVVFGIALSIFNNVNHHSLPLRKIKAEAVLREIANGETDKKNLNGFKITSTIAPYELDPTLSVITVTAFDKNNIKVAELQRVVITKE